MLLACGDKEFTKYGKFPLNWMTAGKSPFATRGPSGFGAARSCGVSLSCPISIGYFLVEPLSLFVQSKKAR
jgi:hypothetical protein